MSFDYTRVVDNEREYNLGVSEEGKLVGAVVLVHHSGLTGLLGKPTPSLQRFKMFSGYGGTGADKIILEKVLDDFRNRGEAIAAFLNAEGPLADLFLRKGFKERDGFLYWTPGGENE